MKLTLVLIGLVISTSAFAAEKSAPTDALRCTATLATSYSGTYVTGDVQPIVLSLPSNKDKVRVTRKISRLKSRLAGYVTKYALTPAPEYTDNADIWVSGYEDVPGKNVEFTLQRTAQTETTGRGVWGWVEINGDQKVEGFFGNDRDSSAGDSFNIFNLKINGEDQLLIFACRKTPLIP